MISEPPKISTPSVEMYKQNNQLIGNGNVILSDDHHASNKLAQHTNFQKKNQPIVFLD